MQTIRPKSGTAPLSSVIDGPVQVASQAKPPCLCRVAGMCTCIASDSKHSYDAFEPGHTCYEGFDSLSTPRCACVKHEHFDCLCLNTPPDGRLSWDDEPQSEVESIVQDSGWPRVPRPPQQWTIDYMLTKSTSDESGRKFGCIISHAPGMGKTLCGSEAAKQAIERVQNDPEHPLYALFQVTTPCTVIICPPHLMRMWFDHIDKQHPDDTISLCSSDTKANRLAVLAPGYQWYIINYQALRRNDYFDLIKALPICVLICDESHNVKNPSAAQSKRVLELSQLPTVTHRFLLSATPIKKEADDLYMQLHIVDPRVFHSQQRYLSEYCNADYTRYGARNVRLQNHAKTRLQYVNPRTKCTNPLSPETFGKTFEPVRYEYDWNHPDPMNGKPYTRIEIPAVPACECCPPYEFNTETVTEVIPPPPPPSLQTLKVNLADWLTNGEAENAEKIESVDAFKRRKLFRINSTYVPPEPQTIVHEKGISPSAYIMGFSYKDVGMYLPPVVSPTCLVPMNSDTRQVYESVKDSWRAAIPDIGNIDLGSAMAAMHALRVLTCCDNKLEALANLIDDAPEGNAHVIFCAYEMTAKVVAQHLQGIKDPKVMPRFIAGHIKPDERDAYAASMARDGLPIVATLQSMSEGVDLSYARFVYFFEEDWTPGVMYQALSRVQRERAKEKDGRSPVPTSEIESIVCNYIMCESSIDEHVHMVSQDRTKNARDILRVELAVSR